MKVTSEKNYENFEFWAGGRDTVEDLTEEELETVWDYLETVNDEMTETEINDFFWFERDHIAELLGYNDYDELLLDRTTE